MMSEEFSLIDFPSVPEIGTITVVEYGAQLLSLESDPNNPIEALEFCNKLENYHRINGSNWKPTFQQMIPSIRTTNFQESILVSKSEGIIKGIWDSWRENGWRGLHNYLSNVEKNSVTQVLYGCLSACSTASDTIKQLRHRTTILFFPHLALHPDLIIQDAARVRNWDKSWIRAISWHPNYSKIALALNDDTVRICSNGHKTVPLLRFTEQKKVSCIAWRPCTDLQIAVGVELGIVIWNLQTSISIKPGAFRAKLITKKNHAPVTCIDYSRSGLLMLSSSSFDTCIYVWDVTSWEPTPLQRIGGGGVPLVSWSPNNKKILSTSPSTVFRIWSGGKTWSTRSWNTPKQPIEAACWNSDGTTLLFASAGMIYALHFVVNPIDKFINQKDCVSVPMFDISQTYVSSEDKEFEYKVGGKVRQMDIDPSGNRLALFFDDSELVAVFRIQPRSQYYLSPCGYIRGFPNEFPVALQFQKDFKDGSLLTIAWSTGRLQYFPFIFASFEENKNLMHQDFYKIPSTMRKSEVSKVSPRKAGQEKVFVPKLPNSSFRSSSFIDPTQLDDTEFEFIPRSSTDPLKLFSLDKSKASFYE